jgi:transketolase
MTRHRLGLTGAELAEKALRLRRHVVRMVAPIGEGYVGQGLGAADIMAALYFHEMAYDPDDPHWEGRDRFLLSPAHYGVILFAALAERGALPVQELAQYGVDGSPLEIIASERLPGVEATLGSLGMGLSVGVGMALSLRRRGSTSRVYVVIGDGELQEGETWEAVMSAAAFKLGNVCAIVDVNDMQVDGATTAVLNMGDIAAKWRAFGWNVIELDGHDRARRRPRHARCADRTARQHAPRAWGQCAGRPQGAFREAAAARRGPGDGRAGGLIPCVRH